MAREIWRYRVREPDGSIREDHLRAESLDEVMTQLRIQEADVVSVEQVSAIDGLDTVESAARQSQSRSARLEPDSDRPPPAPRSIPRGTTGMAGGFILIAVGAVFTVAASIFIVTGLGLLLAGESAGIFMTLFPLIHFSVGVGLLTYALRGKAKRRDVIANGHVAMARIDEAGLDRSTKINGRSPYKIGYDFEVNGQSYAGKRSTMNKRITRHHVGDRIWVLYDVDDPKRNVEWPPL